MLFADNLQTHSWSFECASTTCAGFDVLQGLLIQQPGLPDVYKALAALLLGKRTSHDVEEMVNDISSSQRSPVGSTLAHWLHYASSTGVFG